MVFRGFAVVARYVKKFLEMHGYNIHLGAWVDIRIMRFGSPVLVFDFQIGTWLQHRPPKRGVPCALYVVAEGRIPREARNWLSQYDYLFCPSRWVREKLQEIDLDCIYMPHGIDTELFKPLPLPKTLDVLSIGIHSSPWDFRKYMDKVPEVCRGLKYYAHTQPTLPYEGLPVLYNITKTYLSLSASESFNIPVLEANACGVPVIYNDAPATNEHAYGVGIPPRRIYEVCVEGYYITIHEPNIPRIRDVLLELLRKPKTIEEMGKKAREHALRYDYRKTYRPLLEILPKP